MGEHEQLKNDRKDNLSYYGYIYVAIIAVLLFSLVMFGPGLLPDKYYYRAYILEDQYIGDITDNGQIYTDVLIFEVQPLVDKSTGSVFLPEPEYKYGYHTKYNLNDDPLVNFYMDPKIGLHKLYFAKEHSLRSDLETNDIIVARWHNSLFGSNYIRGIETIYQCGWWT
jgi:hypothetical protein